MLFALLLLDSCKTETSEESVPTVVEENLSSVEDGNLYQETQEFQERLQGTWKRIDYPFSRYRFKDDKAKLISEGQAEEPEFIPFELLKSCRFADEANAVLAPEEFILNYKEYESCELIHIRNDTLRVAALDVNYEIFYTKQ